MTAHENSRPLPPLFYIVQWRRHDWRRSRDFAAEWRRGRHLLTHTRRAFDPPGADDDGRGHPPRVSMANPRTESHIYICTAPRGSNRHTLCTASHGSRQVESYDGLLTRRMRFFRAPASPEANERKSETADNEVSTCGDGADGKRKTAVFDAIWHKTAGFFHRKLPMERQTHGMERPFHPVRFAKHPFGGGKKGPDGARALLKGGQRQPSALTL